jgi:hypothetical protein
LEGQASSRTVVALQLLKKINSVISKTSTSDNSTKIGNNFVMSIRDRLKDEEACSCLCIIFIDGANLEAKIVHTGRGKFKILNDEHGGKYTNRIVDASDIICCKIET